MSETRTLLLELHCEEIPARFLKPLSEDLEAKLAGLQTPRGWGLHLIRHMVDDLIVSDVDGQHVVELIIRLVEPQP